MSAINAPLQPTTNVQPASSGGPTNAFNSLNEKAFLRLLTTQLQHQDPTQPMNQQQLAAQLAQFSTATGVDRLNTNISKVVSNQKNSAITKAAGLIGKQVTTAGDALVTDSQGEAKGAFSLAKPAHDVQVKVTDDTGKTVARINLDPLGPGAHTFDWKGGSPNAAYRFKVTAADGKGGRVDTTTSSLYTVNGVKSTGNGIELNLAGNPATLALNKVQQVL